LLVRGFEVDREGLFSVGTVLGTIEDGERDGTWLFVWSSLFSVNGLVCDRLAARLELNFLINADAALASRTVEVVSWEDKSVSLWVVSLATWRCSGL
jgi:hypothetical protein